MPALCRIDSPAATSSPPIQLASTGLSAMVQWAFNWSAVTGRVDHRLGRQDHQQAVGVRVPGDDLQRLDIAVGAGVAEQVDGIAMTPGQGEDAVERLDALGRQGGQSAAASDQGIGGEHAGAARVGQDRQAAGPSAAAGY